MQNSLKKIIFFLIASGPLSIAYGFDLLDDDQMSMIWSSVDEGALSTESAEILFENESTIVEAGLPVIQLVSPDLSTGTVSPPFDIELRFIAESGSAINMQSLKVTYLFFGQQFDITDAVVENAEISEDRILAKNAQIKKRGKQKIKIQISDDKNRSQTEIIKFKIK